MDGSLIKVTPKGRLEFLLTGIRKWFIVSLSIVSIVLFRKTKHNLRPFPVAVAKRRNFTFKEP